MCGLTPSFSLLILFIFLAGLFLTGFEITCMLYVSEIGAERFRKYSVVALMSGWAIGQIFFPMLYAYVNNWRLAFIFVIGFPITILALLIRMILDESPRYQVG